jgi:hypothetical protein
MIRAAALSCSLLAWSLAVPPALVAAAPLFPTPLHITRQVSDSISGKTAVIEEYGYGNRLVAVRGSRTSIADYDKGELVEIDRDAATYSITRFDAVARANQIVNPTASRAAAASSAGKAEPALRSLGVKATKSGRSADFFEREVGAQEKVTVAVDRAVLVSKDALDVLVGAAYPSVRTSEHDVVLSAAAPAPSGSRISAQAAGGGEAMYALPVEQVTALDADGQHAEFRSTVVRVGAEAPPVDRIAIPPGARLVTSRIVEVAREIENVDHPAPPVKTH